MLAALVFIFFSYIVVGTLGAIALRWENGTEGLDLLLDIALWPLLVYFWMRYGKD